MKNQPNGQATVHINDNYTPPKKAVQPPPPPPPPKAN